MALKLKLDLFQLVDGEGKDGWRWRYWRGSRITSGSGQTYSRQKDAVAGAEGGSPVNYVAEALAGKRKAFAWTRDPKTGKMARSEVTIRVLDERKKKDVFVVDGDPVVVTVP